MSAYRYPQDRKAEILAATLDLAFGGGPIYVTNGMHVGPIDLSQSDIYRRFPKKEDIWQAIVTLLCSHLRKNAELAAQSSDTPLASLKRSILGHLEQFIATPAPPEIVARRDPGGNLAAIRHHIPAAMGELHEALRRMLGAAGGAGQLRSGLDIGAAEMPNFRAVQSWVLQAIVTRHPAFLEQNGERLFDLQQALTRTEGSPR